MCIKKYGLLWRSSGASFFFFFSSGWSVLSLLYYELTDFKLSLHRDVLTLTDCFIKPVSGVPHMQTKDCKQGFLCVCVEMFFPQNTFQN